MPPDPEIIAQKMAALREHFIAERLPLLVAQIDGQVRRATAAGWDPALVDEARRGAHSLKGSSGSHGLVGVHAAAAALETALVGTTAPPPDLERLVAALRAAEHATRQAP
jgi:HPt (histidine-containing phosphotransfer) domain-containing protein